MESLTTSGEEICKRPPNKRFQAPATYSLRQLAEYGLVVEGNFKKINHAVIFENESTKHIQVVSEIIQTEEGIETRLHPTHAAIIHLVSQV